MALPVSGELKFSEIANAVSAFLPYSLRNMSASAGFVEPDSVSEFYGYGPESLRNIYWDTTIFTKFALNLIIYNQTIGQMLVNDYNPGFQANNGVTSANTGDSITTFVETFTGDNPAHLVLLIYDTVNGYIFNNGIVGLDPYFDTTNTLDPGGDWYISAYVQDL